MDADKRIAVRIEGLTASENIDGDRVALQLGAFTEHLLFHHIGEKRAQPLGALKAIAVENPGERSPDRLVAWPFGWRHRWLQEKMRLNAGKMF